MQTLEISGFLGIKSAKIEVDQITVIIGEQATGKSIIARLIYFFNEYFANFDDLSLSKNEHKSTYDKRKKEEFYQIFPQYSWEADEFKICFSNQEHTVELSSLKNSTVVELKTSTGVASYFRNLKRKFAEFSEQASDTPLALARNSPFAQTRILREFRRVQDEFGIPRYESPLFVPAARSFYATIRDEIFSILALDNKIDKIILQFGEFYETAKASRFARTSPHGGSGSNRIENEYFHDIIRGQLIREDGRDWIEMERGRIELGRASSGQQEAAPLLVAISRFPQPGRTLIIEEPEAHLFPVAQIKVLDFMVRQAVSRRTSIVFTTHSPYLLSALNNYLLRAKAGMSPSISSSVVRAYSVGGGKSQSLIDLETDLISAEYIDSVSEAISAEFDAVLEAMISEM